MTIMDGGQCDVCGEYVDVLYEVTDSEGVQYYCAWCYSDLEEAEALDDD